MTDPLWIVRMLGEKLEFPQFGEKSDGESCVLGKIKCAAIAIVEFSLHFSNCSDVI